MKKRNQIRTKVGMLSVTAFNAEKPNPFAALAALRKDAKD